MADAAKTPSLLPPEGTQDGTVHFLSNDGGNTHERWLWAGSAWWFAPMPGRSYPPREMADLGWTYAMPDVVGGLGSLRDQVVEAARWWAECDDDARPSAMHDLDHAVRRLKDAERDDGIAAEARACTDAAAAPLAPASRTP